MKPIIALAVALAGCATVPDRPAVTSADFCGRQGSEMAAWQCRQYYARVNVEPPQQAPVEREPSVNTGFLLAAILAGYHPIQPYYMTPYAMPVQHSITCIRVINAVTCD